MAGRVTEEHEHEGEGLGLGLGVGLGLDGGLSQRRMNMKAKGWG